MPADLGQIMSRTRADVTATVETGESRWKTRLARVATRMCEEALELISPTRCASCERAGELICERCLAETMFIDPKEACAHCGAPFGRMLCTECDGTSTVLDRCVAAAVFDGPPSRIVRAYKDAGERRLGALIAQAMAHAARNAEERDPQRFSGLLSAADAVVFVPATASAYRRRGFDHMELIARAFCEETGLPLVDALAKRGSVDQRELGREQRIERSLDVYAVVAPELVEGRRVLLLDDVITTGATLTAAAQALKGAGARRVDGVAYARVWG
ncbi:MAG: phosphoribosyltransferase family protein [Coriobacteriaceae bacterium]|nr:phosphoribosyltransferase family protein [Coriobacteriaceae bacterium]